MGASRCMPNQPSQVSGGKPSTCSLLARHGDRRLLDDQRDVDQARDCRRRRAGNGAVAFQFGRAGSG